VNSTVTDTDLVRIVAAWPALPSPIRAAIVALLDSTAGPQSQ
jgi:hypothetical protein